MTKLRDFQQWAKDDTLSAWRDGAKNVALVMPTGAGKTVVFADMMASHQGASVAIAHRQEIVSQISLALARNDVRHRVIGSASVARTCSSLHLNELKRNYVDQKSRVAVAGVDTLIRMNPKEPWFSQVTLVVQDECHHVLKNNKWGKAQMMFPNAIGLGVTATPCRADGCGLGRHADGIMDYMVVGPTMRELINDKWLTEYRIFAPPSNLDMHDVPLSPSGDFSPKKLSIATKRSTIHGDVVAHYLRIAPGKLGVTFAVDVDAAVTIAKAFRNAGVPAEVVSAKTPDALRASVLRKFKTREILQLVNVDLFGEGFDLPAIEVVSMARKTESYALFAQQFGRSLRPMDGKTHAIIIDHVGNIHRHGLPDAPREWTLNRRDKRAPQNKNTIFVKTCPQCVSVYEAFLKSCPYCGFEPVPRGRSAPEEVDGDLYELSEEALVALRGQIDAPPTFPYVATPVIVASIKKHHIEKLKTREKLRSAMATWAGGHSQGTDETTVRELQRRFFHTFGIDVATAQTLNRSDTEALIRRIEK